MQPSDKSFEMEASLTNLFGFDRKIFIAANRCVPAPYGCGGDAKDFRDETSRKEYTMSGMCQACQDAFFGGDE